jgi:uncharacterized protein (TIGR03435 family)
MNRLPTLILLSVLAQAPAANAQTVQRPGPTFEAATVRENTSGEARTRIELVNGRFNAVNMTLRELVSIAYPTDGGRFRHANQLVGGPGWFSAARFDIVAKAEESRIDTNRSGFTASAADREAVERVRLMLQHLLAGRFALRVHHETRQLPIYELVRLDNRGELGRDLRRAITDCAAEWKKQGMPDARSVACGSIQSGGRGGRATGSAVEMGPFVRDLYDWTGRPVVDRTGLTGRFDFTLTWAPEGSTGTDAPSIFTAVQEQLGLRLVPARGPVDVLVVDAAERPEPE